MAVERELRRVEIDLSELDFLASCRADDSPDYPSVPYLDSETGAVYSVSLNALGCLEDGEDPEGLDEEDACSLEVAAAIVEDAAGRFVRVPYWQSRDEFRLMERFAADCPPRAQDHLHRALEGRKPFRHFKAAVDAWPGLREKWFAFREFAHREELLAWLAQLGVDAVDVSPSRRT